MLALENGTFEPEGRNVLRASDQTLIYVRSCGLLPSGEGSGRVVFDFDVATSSPLAWLNTGTFVGTRTVDEDNAQITLEVTEISEVSVPTSRLVVTDPEGVPDQLWECSTATGTAGDSVFTETVTLSDLLSVGATERGTRNIIPITVCGAPLPSQQSPSLRLYIGPSSRLRGNSLHHVLRTPVAVRSRVAQVTRSCFLIFLQKVSVHRPWLCSYSAISRISLAFSWSGSFEPSISRPSCIPAAVVGVEDFAGAADLFP